MVAKIGSNFGYSYSNTNFPYARQVAASYANKGMVTGSKTRVLGTGTFLFNVTFYDDRGRPIQTQSTNLSGGKDVVTMQYDFTGKVLGKVVAHQKAGANAQSHTFITSYAYDHAGRLLTVTKIPSGGGGEVVISSNNYDALGQLSEKEVGQKRNFDDPNQVAYQDPIETLKYEYNIRGWLAGINKQYARGNNGDHWFGMELGYDFGFTEAQFNGNISGTIWRTKGSNEQRAYGFSYDAANRLMSANFTQYTSGLWNVSAGVDYSVKMGDGITPSSAYDANGNIMRMVQKGLKVNASSTIDSLLYEYTQHSNKLVKVTDKVTDDNKLGDFTDGSNTNNDYTYDVNGNLNTDQNKRISNIWSSRGLL